MALLTLLALASLLSSPSSVLSDEEVWEKDASNDVYIEASREGFEVG